MCTGAKYARAIIMGIHIHHINNLINDEVQGDILTSNVAKPNSHAPVLHETSKAIRELKLHIKI